MNDSIASKSAAISGSLSSRRRFSDNCRADRKRAQLRILFSKMSSWLFLMATCLALVVLAVLILRIVLDGGGFLDWQFIISKASIRAQKAGILGAIMGSLGLMLIVIPVSAVIGVGAAIYLEEYAEQGRVQALIKTNISNLASVPSIIFGLLGLAIFSRFMKLGSSILAAGLTISLLVLPIVIVSSQEAIKAVPSHLKEAAYGIGADKWTMIRTVILPHALPGILTGTILAVSRALGETAPLVALGIPTLIMKLPNSIMDDFTALPIQIYYWTLDSVLTAEYANLAAATIIVLLVVLLSLNATAIAIRNKFQRE